MEAVTEEDIVSVARTLIRKAKGGNVEAIKALFDRVFGKCPQSLYLGLDDTTPDGDERFL